MSNVTAKPTNDTIADYFVGLVESIISVFNQDVIECQIVPDVFANMIERYEQEQAGAGIWLSDLIMRGLQSKEVTGPGNSAETRIVNAMMKLRAQTDSSALELQLLPEIVFQVVKRVDGQLKDESDRRGMELKSAIQEKTDKTAVELNAITSIKGRVMACILVSGLMFFGLGLALGKIDR